MVLEVLLCSCPSLALISFFFRIAAAAYATSLAMFNSEYESRIFLQMKECPDRDCSPNLDRHGTMRSAAQADLAVFNIP